MKRMRLVIVLFMCGVLLWPQTVEENKDKGIKTTGVTPIFQKYAIPFENQWAFIIGINDYPFYENLKFAEPEARKVKNLLIDRYGYEPKKVEYFARDKATDENIMNQLKWYVVNLKAKENLFIYFSGHGLKDDILNTAYWLPSDVGYDKREIKNKRERINKSKLKISSHNIIDIMRESQAKHIFIVADSCFSAQLFRRPEETQHKGFPPKSFERKSRQLFASGRELVGDGIFGKHFIKFLNDNKQTSLMASDLISEVKRDVMDHSTLEPEGRAVGDTGDKYGEFFFFLKKNVLVEQNENDFKEIQSTIHSKKGSIDDRLNQCNEFLVKYKGVRDSIPKSDSKIIKNRYLQVLKFKEDLLYEKQLNDVDINKYLSQGDKAFGQGKYEIAQNHYDKILKKRPGDPFAKEKIKKCQNAAYDKKAAFALYKEKKFDEANNYLEKLAGLSPFDSEVNTLITKIKKTKWHEFVKNGNRYFNRNNYRDAIDTYREALNLFSPDSKEFKELNERGFNNASITRRINICNEKLALIDLKDDKLKLKTYLEFVKKYPNSPQITALKKQLKLKDKNLPSEKYWDQIRKNKKGYWENHFENNHIMVWIPGINGWVDKYEVSNRQWENFLNNTNRKISKAPLGNMQNYIHNYPEYPAMVTFKEAGDYCKKHGLELLSKKHWMVAAVKDIGFKYPWGNDEPYADGKIRANSESFKDGFDYTAPAAKFDTYASPYGLVNMSGNAAEWVQENLLKGGGFLSEMEALKVSHEEKTGKDDVGGFRCVRYEYKSKSERKNE